MLASHKQGGQGDGDQDDTPRPRALIFLALAQFFFAFALVPDSDVAADFVLELLSFEGGGGFHTSQRSSKPATCPKKDVNPHT